MGEKLLRRAYWRDAKNRVCRLAVYKAKGGAGYCQPLLQGREKPPVGMNNRCFQVHGQVLLQVAQYKENRGKMLGQKPQNSMR